MKRYILAGGSQNNEAKIFDNKTGGCVGAITLPKPVFTGGWNKACTAFAVAGADGQVRVFNMPKNAA